MLNDERLTSAAIDFIKSDNDRAFQIDGDWGVGKTYFVKEKLFKEIRKMELSPILISLSGINSYDELLKAINMEIIISSNDEKNNKENVKLIYSIMEEMSNFSFKGIKIGKAIKKIMNSSINFVKSNDLILFLDDFERANVTMEILLKYIIQLQNQLNNKIFIISNEQKVTKNDKSLYEIKEKIISHTFTFKGDNKKTALNIIKSKLQVIGIEAKYSRWIYSTLNKLLDLTDHINLRVILDYLSCIEIVIIHILNLQLKDKEFEYQLIKTACVTCFSFICMIRFNYDCLNKSFDNYFKDKNIIQIRFNYPLWRDKKDIPSGMAYLDDTFNNKVKCYDDNVVYCNEFYSFIKNGYFDKKSYVNKMKAMFYEDEYNLIEKMAEYRIINSNQLNKIQKDVRDKYIDSEYLNTDFHYVNILCNAYQLYYKFYKIGILCVSKDIFDKIKNKIISIASNDALYNNSYDHDAIDMYYSDLISKIDSNDQIKNIINEKKKDIKEELSNEFAKVVINRYSKYSHNQDIFYKFHLFKVLLNDYFINQFTTDPKCLYYLESNFNFEFNKGLNNQSKRYLNEITTFKDKISKIISEYDVDKIITYNFKELINSLNKAITKIGDNV